MKYLFCAFFFGWTLMIGCQDKSTIKTPTAKTADQDRRAKHLAELEEVAQTLSKTPNIDVGRPLAKTLISESLQFVEKYKNAAEVPAVLFRAGEVARSIGEYRQSIAIFSTIHQTFPENPFAVKALFLEASAFQDGLKDKEQAKISYEKLIEKYPEELLADQARQLLKVIDKSPEELIREFKKQQK